MKRKMLLAASIAMLLLTFLLPGCKKDFDFDRIKAVEWYPDLAIPLVNDSISFEKALIETGTEENFYIDESGEVSILMYFKNNTFKISVQDLVEIPPLGFSYEKTVTAAEQAIISVQDMPLPPVTFTVNLAESSPGLIVQKIHIKKGKIVITSNHTFDNPGYLKVTIPDATLNGQVYTTTFGPFTNGISSDTLDLSGVWFNLTSNPNMVRIQVEGLIKKSDHPVAGDIIRTDYSVQIAEIAWFEGYLGQQTFSPPEDFVKITAFNNAYVLGDLFFVDPQASITIYNSIGIPAAITIEQLKATNEASNVTLDITERLGAGAYFNVPSPPVSATKPATVTMDYTNENTGNSMNEMFNLKPDKVYYKIKTQINPNGQTFNFFSDTSSMYADLRVRLPLFGHFDHLTLQDTFDFAINQQNEVESAMFRTRIRNGLPLLGRMQVWFVDSLYHILDSLTGTNNIMIQEAPVDPATYLPYPGQYGYTDTTFYLDQPRMETLVNARKILVRAVMNSTNNGTTNVKIKAAQSLKLDFNARVRLRQSISLSK